MLTFCIRKLPFIAPDGHLYRQVDGVVLGSPLGSKFANYYMSHIKNLVFNTYPSIKPLVKNTNTMYILNADSHCCQRYKDSEITSYISRAYKIIEKWSDFPDEIKMIKQMLANNNFSNSSIDQHQQFSHQKTF